MEREPTLFELPPATDYKRYPDFPGYAQRDTSFAAAKLFEPKAGTLRAKVLAELQVRGSFGATCDEIEQAFGMSHQTVSARVRELSMGGKIRDSGGRRPTRSGRNAICWVATDGQR
jgi:predicted transcriptional regulator